MLIREGNVNGERLIQLSSSKEVATWLRTALGFDSCNPNNTYYDYYAQQFGYAKFADTPHCKWIRFVFGDADED
ncbi:unnamed protein product [Enterobius vermicularis]|uniref:SAM-dependent methyltransferase n=1 Tax=Enterobius vermicularis TaxID=51028 RepID=A0A0N4VAR1_ENTVE|nr:unnamed protein product [Enterobius vermicularis]